MKKGLLCLLLAALILTGCAAGDKDAGDKDTSLFTVREDGSIAIDTAQLTQTVSFLDISLGEDAVHLLARVEEDGTARLSWNTCQVCSGSPYAYFVLQEDALVCQNCGNRFPVTSIGTESIGCHPWAVEGYAVEEGQIILSRELLTEEAPSFKNWKKGL